MTLWDNKATGTLSPDQNLDFLNARGHELWSPPGMKV
jgi:hypothetical protein